MPFMTIRTNALAPDTTIPDEGVVIPGANTTVVFDEYARLVRLQKSQSLRDLCTDDAYGVGNSTLFLVDTAGVDVPQGFIETFLSYALDDIPGKIERDSNDNDFIYVGRTQTPGALESDSVWQVYRLQLSTDTRIFAVGSANYVHRWDQRESLSYP